jgi:hypothetical protein
MIVRDVDHVFFSVCGRVRLMRPVAPHACGTSRVEPPAVDGSQGSGQL